MEGIKDFIKWKEIYDAYKNNYKTNTINKDYINPIFSKYNVSLISDFYNDDGTLKDSMPNYKRVKRIIKGEEKYIKEPTGKEKKLTDEDKQIITWYKDFKKPLEDATEDLLSKYPKYRESIKQEKTGKNGDKYEVFLKKDVIEDNFKKITQESATTAEDIKDDTKQIKKQQEQTHKAGSEAVERQNKINDELKEKLKEQGLTINDMKDIINETNKRIDEDKAERQAEKADKKRSKAFKELVKDMSQQDDITTVDKAELIKRLIKNHGEIIHDEETAKAAAEAIYRAALNKKVVSKKQRPYLYNFYKAYPQFVEQLPEEQQEAINTEIMDKYNEQQKNKILHYMLPKERPRWEKATTQHNLNPMLGRRAYG